MTGLDILLAVAGCLVTAMAVAGMVLLTPRGLVELPPDDGAVERPGLDPQGEGPAKTEPAYAAAGTRPAAPGPAGPA